MKTQVTREEAIDALRKYRTASHIIRKLVGQLLGCWEDGLRSWMVTENDDVADEGIPQPSDAAIVEYRKAKRLLEESIAINPYYPDAYILLANAYAELDEDAEKQREYYDLAISLDPDDDEFLNARMALSLDSGDLTFAEEDLLRLESLNSRYAESMRQHFEQAREELKR